VAGLIEKVPGIGRNQRNPDFAALNCKSRLQTLLTIRREAVRARATAVALASLGTQAGSVPIRFFFSERRRHRVNGCRAGAAASKAASTR
jgi:hypothetical protein